MNNNNFTSVKIGLRSLCRKDLYSSYFAITKTLAATGIADLEELRIGTVDTMQGQGGTAVIDSMASSSPDYVANQAEWWFPSNRWNVAFPRAMTRAFVFDNFEEHLEVALKALGDIEGEIQIANAVELVSIH